jgi:SWI/SNF-related matrix-associated actin-dependent regulator of chromatin subfamily A protein 2/4
LPTRRELPDYYEIIKKPIDLKRIQARMKDNKYLSMDMLQADIDLMARNTQEYNVEGSLIFDDSITLANVFKSARSRLESEPAEESSDSDNKSQESEDEQDKSMAQSHKSMTHRLISQVFIFVDP